MIQIEDYRSLELMITVLSDNIALYLTRLVFNWNRSTVMFPELEIHLKWMLFSALLRYEPIKVLFCPTSTFVMDEAEIFPSITIV